MTWFIKSYLLFSHDCTKSANSQHRHLQIGGIQAGPIPDLTKPNMSAQTVTFSYHVLCSSSSESFSSSPYVNLSVN